MSDLKKIYSASIRSIKAGENKKVSETRKCYEALSDKTSDYAIIIKSILDLHMESAKIYNNAPDEIVFEHEAF